MDNKIVRFADGVCPKCGGHSYSQILGEPMRCMECDWVGEEQDAEKELAFINRIFEESNHIESVVKAVCPHVQYCGNGSGDYYGNSEPHFFLCRPKMLKYNRHDSLVMIEPFTDEELAAAFKRYCWRHYGETCETAMQWCPRANDPECGR